MPFRSSVVRNVGVPKHRTVGRVRGWVRAPPMQRGCSRHAARYRYDAQGTPSRSVHSGVRRTLTVRRLSGTGTSASSGRLPNVAGGSYSFVGAGYGQPGLRRPVVHRGWLPQCSFGLELLRFRRWRR